MKRAATGRRVRLDAGTSGRARGPGTPNRRHPRSAGVIAVAVWAVLTAGAPVAGVAQGAPSTALGLGGAFQIYGFGTPSEAGLESIAQISTTFAASAGVTRYVELQVRGAYAEGIVTRPNGSEARLSGPTDTEARVNLFFAGGAVTLTGVALLPTGSSTHTAQEAEVAGRIASDLLPFRVTNWGSGGGAAAQLAATQRVGRGGIGFSVSYRMANQFDPLENDAITYQPGDELRVRVALDRDVGARGKATLVVGFQRYAEDQVAGRNLFRSGNRFEAMGSVAFPAGVSSGVIYAGVLRRQQGTFLEFSDIEVPLQDLLVVGAGLRVGGGGVRFLPSLAGRLVRREDGLGQGFTAEVSLGLEFRGGGVTFAPVARGLFGRVTVREGVESDFFGGEAGVSLRFGGGR